MNEADIEARRAFANSSRREPNALGLEPIYGCSKVVDPEAHVIQRRIMHPWALLRIERLHQVDLDLECTRAHGDHVLVNVLTLASIGTGGLETENVDPEVSECGLIEAAHGDLLDSQNFKRSFGHGGSPFTDLGAGAPCYSARAGGESPRAAHLEWGEGCQ
jgi:hypothetical protein